MPRAGPTRLPGPVLKLPWPFERIETYQTTIVRRIDLDCGCFGHIVETQVSWLTVTRNAVLTIACALVMLGPDLPLWPLRRARSVSPS